MDVLTQLLQPYQGWDPRLQKPRVSAVSAGRHARPLEAQDDADQDDPAATVYFRAGRRRAVVGEAAPADGQAV